MAVPLDDYPIHQTPLSMEFPATGDRNFYDRYYLCGFANDGSTMFLSGLGVYPNLGVIDAYITVRIGDKLHTVRTSGAQTQRDRLNPKVGPYRLDVVEPLQKLHVVIDGDEHGVGADLTWTGAHPAIDEAFHLIRRNGRISVEAQRFAQVGTWSGELRVDGTTIEVTDANWSGARDRSWGIRPSGEAEPAGRYAAGGAANAGFWWLYLPIRFDDYGVMIIAQEDADGTRTMNQAVRFWGSADDLKHEDLGFAEPEIVYTPGTRLPERALIQLGRRGKTIELGATILANIPLNSGPGYGNDPDWSHGLWKGDNWVEGATLDSTDPKVKARLPFTLVDHAARFELDGDTGYGLFEHGTIGRHDPTGFADFMAVAP
jgi:hypothetical protein